MFDIGWSEILVIAVVAIIVVGPKELPRMLRSFGKTMGTVRRTANDFKRQFDEALREAERSVDLEDARKSIQSIGDPIADIRKELQSAAVARPVQSASASPSAQATVVAAAKGERDDADILDDGEEFESAYRPEPEPDEAPRQAEPLKTGAAHAARGSDAA